MTIYIMDQTLPRIHNPYEPFAFTDVATEAAGKQEQVYCHFWQLSDTMILGMKDTRLPFLTASLQVLKEAGYASIIRNSGGLGVINDAGILNVSLIFPKHLAATTDAAYEMMATLLQTAFPERTILAYEIADSYCPGTYDLSIDGKKIAGTAQRRIKDGVAVMMYLSINGDQPARGSLVRRFYQAGLKERFGKDGYPAVNPASMTTLEAALGRKFTTQEVIDRLQKALLSLITDQSLYPLKSLDQWLSENNLSEQMQQRLAGMEKRNQPIKEFSDEPTI